MEKSEIYQALSLLKDELETRVKVRILPDKSQVTVGRKTSARLFGSVFLLCFILGGIYLLLYGDLSSYGFISIICFIIGIGFCIYGFFSTNRTVLIDFEKQLFTIKYFSFPVSEYYFEDLKNIINETQIINKRYAGVKLKIEFEGGNSYEIAHFKNQKEINAMNAVFNLVKQYGHTHITDIKNPFVDKMNQLTDEELITAIRKRDNYNQEAQEALKKIGLERKLIDNDWEIISADDVSDNEKETTVAKPVSPDDDIRQRVFAVISKQLNLTCPLNEEMTFHGLQADELDNVEIYLALEKEFGISISFESADIDNAGPATRKFLEKHNVRGAVTDIIDVGNIGIVIDMVVELVNAKQNESMKPLTDEQPAKSTEKKQPANLNFGEWDMVYVDGGKFNATLGDTTDEGEEIVIKKKVELKAFYIGRYTVTRAQWFAIMQNEKNPSNGNLPVTDVSWADVQAFIAKLNEQTGKYFRLPTAAEWEYAATGGKHSKGYKFSGSNNADEVAWHGGNSGSVPHEVGTKKPNELGIYDMTGNVWEWCADRWGNYQNHPTFGGRQVLNMMRSIVMATGNIKALEDIDKGLANPQEPEEGAYRVRRGCSCHISTPYVHDSIRFTEVADASYNDTGFRLAHDANE
jgi:acyl carrier protein